MERGSKSRGGRPWSFDREQAVETAMRLFWRHGYEGVSVGDLTKAIGIAPPSLYAAFGSKAGLYQEALARYEGSIGRLDFAAVAQADDRPKAVRLLLEAAIEAVTHPDRERGCMISSGMVTCHPDHAALARDLAARREDIRMRIVQALQPFGDNETIPGLARHLAAVMQGISIQARDGSSRAELQEIVEDVVAGLDRRQSRSQSSR
ncbi:TetR/AcrR family transcriptional regulator [Labrys neptuniae]|uniref:TetR/AcrR family transcriptional regulator n=1 Tax=Labrys neptuniae TaxID=376174 RepID=A0ABV3PHE4_9HYPH